MIFEHGGEQKIWIVFDGLTLALGHADRDEPFRHYATGLLLPLERELRIDGGRS